MPSGKSGKFWAVIGILLFIVVIYFLSRHTHLIIQILYKSGALAPVVAVLLYPLLAPTPITTDPVTVVVGVIYGPFIGASLAIVGNMMSAVIEYYVGIKIGKATNFEKIKEKIPLGLGKMPVNSSVFLIFGRMVPGYGSKIISFLAGIHKVPMRRYIWTTLVTTVAGAIILSYGGSGLVHLIKISKILRILKL